MSVDVTIKNIPLSHLKDQNQSFFGSDLYNNAVSLFNTYKQPVANTESGMSLESEILPLAVLRKILLSKIQDQNFTYSSNEEYDDMIFISLSGKIDALESFTASRHITKCASEIAESRSFLARTVSSNSLINGAKAAKANMPTSAVSDDILQAILKPESTSDTLYDIANKSKFYDTIVHPDLYDDKRYSQEIFKRIATNSTFSLTALPLTGLKKALDDKFGTRNKNVLKSIVNLREKLLYKITRRDKDDIEPTNIFDDLTNEDIINKAKKAIEITLATRYRGLQFEIYKETILTPQFTHTITHNRANSHCKFAAIGLDGKSVDHLITDLVLTDNDATVTFSNYVSGTFLLLFDTFTPENINTVSFVDYQANISQQVFNQFEAATLNSKIVISVTNYNIDYGFIEIRKADKSLLTPLRIEYFDDRIELLFDKDYTALEVFILPTYKVLAGSNNIRVNPYTIKTFLSTYDIFSDNVVLWRDN